MSLIRPAQPHDAAAVLRLIHELALFEREPDAVKNTEAELSSHLFGPEPRVHAHVVEQDGEVLGFALWFLTYSTWEGTHGIHLEDLYVRESARGAGHGKALLSTLAQIAVERGYKRVEWSVLDWNTSAIGFYDSLGAGTMDGWSVRRLEGTALAELGATA